MNKQQIDCQSDSVHRFLNEQMAADEIHQFESHLDHCADCQQKLTDATAGGSWWHETSEFLGHEPDVDVSETVSFLNPTDDPHMLGRFGGYEIAGVIGQGGMGVVLKGFDNSLNRFAAIKVLAPQLATRGSARNRFAREAQAAAAVVHDNVIAIHGVAEAAGLPYLVMPYVRGESLQKRIDRDGPMTATEVVRIAYQVASGLAAAHAQGLVHRDIKPANILLPEGIQRVLITDFGLARAVDDSNLTGTGTIAGTPQFMSPEQARGDTVDPRSDLFSLGTVMYTMCTGRNPYRAENPYGVLRRIIEDRPRSIREVNPDIPVWLQSIIEKLQSKSPEDRYQNALGLSNLLEACLAHLQNPSVQLPAELQSVATASSKKTKAILLPVGLAVLAVVLGGWAILNGVLTEQQNPDSAFATKQQEDKNTKSLTSDEESKAEQQEAELAAEQKHLADKIRQEQAQRDEAKRREKLIQLSNQMMALQQEANFLGARRVERKILEILKDSDKDHDRINELRKSMIEARLEGEHERADEIIINIKRIERDLEHRYADIDRLRELEDKSQARNKLVERYQELMVAGKHDEAEAVDREIEAFTRQLEIEWLQSNAEDPFAESPGNATTRDPMAGAGERSPGDATENLDALESLVRLENALLDAHVSLQAANLDLSNANKSLEHSRKLVEKGYVTPQQVDADELAVKRAELSVTRSRNDLTLAEEKRESLRPDLLQQLRSDQSTKSRIKTVIFLIGILESQLQVELQKYNPQHPKVQSLKKQIDYWRKFAPDASESGN